MEATRNVEITKSAGGPTTDIVVVEEPLEIRVGRKPVAVTMRTPGDDHDLVAGFLYTEGIVHTRSDIDMMRHWGSPNVVRVQLRDGLDLDHSRLQRNFYATSSCGICGKASINALRVFTKPIESEVRVARLALMAEILRHEQKSFATTGAIHGAGAFRADGEFLFVREDVGRHNAVDKVAGALFQARTTADVIVVSGRASFEVVQKCIVARVPVIAAVGAPSSLAIELAQEYGVTLVGFLRDGRYNVYCGEQRLR